MGYGRTDAADGRVFPYVFNLPIPTGARRPPWSNTSAAGGRPGQAQGQEDRPVYHDSAYGKEPIPTLQKLSEKLRL